jgi:RTA1 like protein
MVYVGSGYSIIRPSFVTPVFVGFDVLAIATQGFGSAILFGTDVDLNKLKTGRAVLILGLFIQLGAFVVSIQSHKRYALVADFPPVSSCLPCTLTVRPRFLSANMWPLLDR